VLGIRDQVEVDRARAALQADCDALAPPFLPMRHERDLSLEVPGARLRARLYLPTSAPERPPLLVFFHGGGFVLGSIESHDRAVRVLAEQSSLAVLSVDYRLAPEHRAPTPIEDGFASYGWAREHAAELGVDPDSVAIGGDSAGANISAVVAHLCRDRGAPLPALQLLIYPAVDLTCTFASHRTFGNGYAIDEARVEWFLAHYIRDHADRGRPEISPWFAERFDGLPPAIIITAGFDGLRDEAHAYAGRLRAAGVPVRGRCESALTHGFFNMGGVVDEARAANRRIAADLRQMLHRP
jgi:acetyl esterase